MNRETDIRYDKIRAHTQECGACFGNIIEILDDRIVGEHLETEDLQIALLRIAEVELEIPKLKALLVKTWQGVI